MDHLHEMLIEDEIIMCGVVLIAGIVTGVISRVIYAARQRKAATQPQSHTSH